MFVCRTVITMQTRFLFLFLVSSSISAVYSVSNHSSPNVLIILADDLGWGDVSFHGSHQIPTPNIDLLASSGIILNNYYVSPICSPSRSALLTGYNPIRTGMQVGVIAASEPYGLPLQFRTLGNHFQSLGYDTHLVGKWHQGFFQKDYLPTRRGFHSFFGYLTGHVDYYNRTGGDGYTGYDFRENENPGNLSKYMNQYSTDFYTDRVIDLIERHASSDKTNPFMIYMAHQSVHAGNWYQQAIEPPKRFENRFKYIKNDFRRKFAGMVAALDESVGRVFKALNDSGMLDNTIILFSTDNGGASTGQNGVHIDLSMGSNWPLKGSKYTLWEGGVRGTAFLWTSQNKQPYVSHQLMHITDVLPTLYSAAGGNLSHLGDIDGIDQWQSLLNPNLTSEGITNGPRSQLLHNIDHTNKFWAVRYKNYKLTSGTYSFGNFDDWYLAPGQDKEHPPSDICYNCTDVYQVLHEKQIIFDTVNLKVDCERAPGNTACNGTNIQSTCLFDLDQDPCERNNVASKYPHIVDKLLAIYQDYNKQYSKPVNQPSDPASNPALHNHFWSPWK